MNACWIGTAGPDAEGIQPALERMRQNGIHAVLDYAAEDDVASERLTCQPHTLAARCARPPSPLLAIQAAAGAAGAYVGIHAVITCFIALRCRRGRP